MYLRSNDSRNGKKGTPYYVGKGKGMRAFDKHHRCKPPSDSSLIIFMARHLSECDAHQLEMLLIHVYGRIDNKTGCLANLTDGGEGQHGRIVSEKEKLHKSKWMKSWRKAFPLSKETKEKIRDAQIGKSRKPHTKEWKAAQSLRSKGNKVNVGRFPSQETRAKMSISQKKRGPRSEETKVRMSMAQQLVRRKCNHAEF